MGFSNFVEISAFTLTLFVAQLGRRLSPDTVIVANLAAAICYMFPLALSIATLAQVGLAAGGRTGCARISVDAGLALASARAAARRRAVAQ